MIKVKLTLMFLFSFWVSNIIFDQDFAYWRAMGDSIFLEVHKLIEEI